MIRTCLGAFAARVFAAIVGGGAFLLALVFVFTAGTQAIAQTMTAPNITSEGPFLVDEGETAVATLTADDSDTATTDLIWTNTGSADSGKFSLTSEGVLTFSAAKDYEAPDDVAADGSYEVTVQVSDGTETDSTDLVVTLENVVELTTFSGPTMVTFAENGATRVATFSYSSDEDRDGIQWLTGGVDRGLFSLDSPSGALRFLQAPDFENPLDVGPPGRGTNNSYELKLVAWARDSGPIFTDEVDVKVTVTDVDEAGALSLSSTRPALDAVLRAVLTDPDGVTAGTALWQWERSTGRNSWAAIDGTAAASYTPVAADTNTFLRVTATYADEHGTGKTVNEVAANVVTEPLLTGLTAETDDSQADTARGLYPAFDPLTLHYGIGCNGTDTLVLTVSAAANARVGVAGVQAASAPMAVDPIADLVAAPTDLLNTTRDWYSDFTGPAGAMVTSLRDLAANGESFSRSWRDVLGAADTVTEADIRHVYPGSADRAVATFQRRGDYADRSLEYAGARADAGADLVAVHQATTAALGRIGERVDTDPDTGGPNRSSAALTEGDVLGSFAQIRTLIAIGRRRAAAATQDAAARFRQEELRRGYAARRLADRAALEAQWAEEQATIAAAADQRIQSMYGGFQIPDGLGGNSRP